MRVDVADQVDHPRDLAFRDDHVVERVVACHRFARALHFAGQHAAARDAVFIVQRPLEFGIQLLDRDGGEKAEPAEVHREHWNVAPGNGARRREQGSIAAEHDHQLAAVGDQRAIEPLQARVFGRDGIEPDLDAACAEPLNQARQQLAVLLNLRLGDDPDSADQLHTAGIPYCLRRRAADFPSGQS